MSVRGRKALDAFMPSLNTASSEGRAELACSCLALCLDKITSYVMRTETEDSSLVSFLLTDAVLKSSFQNFKTAHSPELKFRNFATNRDLQKPHLF